jgi:hypothetical protein
MMHANAIALINGTWRYVSALEERVEWRQTELTVTAFTQDGYHRNGLRPQDVRRFAEDYNDRVIVPTIKPVMAYVVEKAYEVKWSWATASNYTMYRIHPGTYPVTWQNRTYDDWNPEMQGDGWDVYWATVTTDATRLYSYSVNRLFQASSSRTEQHGDETPFSFSDYAYAARGDAEGGARGRWVEVEPATGEISPIERLAELETTAQDDATWAEMSAARVRELEILRELAGLDQL